MQEPPRVLFVDDDAATREGFTQYLISQGFDVVTAQTGHDALTIAHTTQIEVVVLDLGLPDIDGWGGRSSIEGRRSNRFDPNHRAHRL